MYPVVPPWVDDPKAALENFKSNLSIFAYLTEKVRVWDRDKVGEDPFPDLDGAWRRAAKLLGTDSKGVQSLETTLEKIGEGAEDGMM